MNKIELRSFYRSIRSNIKNREKAENVIVEKFLGSDLFLNAESIFLYFSYKDEVSTELIAYNTLKLGKKLAYPVCTDTNGHMEFYSVESPENLTEGMYSIMEPDRNICERAIPDSNTLTVVPALCFDRRGYRLGYGKGYYDRFLSDYAGKSIGLAFEECVCDSLPCDFHDIKVDSLITDKKIYNFSLVKEE